MMPGITAHYKWMSASKESFPQEVSVISNQLNMLCWQCMYSCKCFNVYAFCRSSQSKLPRI